MIELALLLLVVGVLFWRAIMRERRDYGRFKRLRTTRMRQQVLRRWLIESVLVLGGLSAVVLLGSGHAVDAARLDTLAAIPALGDASEWLATPLGLAVAWGVAIAFAALLVVPLFLLRGTLDEVPAIGDIRALLPRTRGELPYGAGLAVSAGVFEELLFRLAMPALLFLVIGDGVLAFAVAATLFGLLHVYQGAPGILLSIVLGLAFTTLYLVTGSILVPIAVHVFVDARSLVLLPITIGGVLRGRPTDGRAAPAVRA